MLESVLCPGWFNYPGSLIKARFGCSTFIVFRRWVERPNERVVTVGIGWVLLFFDPGIKGVCISSILL